jgi:hypothetical protein
MDTCTTSSSPDIFAEELELERQCIGLDWIGFVFLYIFGDSKWILKDTEIGEGRVEREGRIHVLRCHLLSGGVAPAASALDSRK